MDPNLGPLDYTESEIFAINIYQGVAPDEKGLGSNAQAYKTMNTILFPGIDHEIERICDDDTRISPEAIYQADELMDRLVDLYTVMYKYGKRMTAERAGYKVARNTTIRKIIENGRTISNFSTSANGFNQMFSKADIALIYTIIEQGTPCADFTEILGDDNYYFSNELETLVAPMCQVELIEERLPETVEEKKIKNNSGGLASKVYKIRISPPKKDKISLDDKKEYFEKSKKYISDKYRTNAATFIAKLQDLKNSRFSKEQIISIMNKEDLKMYLEWKDAFAQVYYYRIRERMAEIDRKVNEAHKNGKPMYIHKQGNILNENNAIRIPMAEISSMANGQDYCINMAKYNKVINYISGILGKIKGNNRDNK